VTIGLLILGLIFGAAAMYRFSWTDKPVRNEGRPERAGGNESATGLSGLTSLFGGG
jgi:hypothetical protein